MTGDQERRLGLAIRRAVFFLERGRTAMARKILREAVFDCPPPPKLPPPPPPKGRAR